jgi:excisionase family DNA binding protein
VYSAEMTSTQQPEEDGLVFRRWLNQKEAAAYLGVTDRTIRNYIRTGAIVGYQLPGSRLVRLDRAALDRAVEAHPMPLDDL